MSVCPILQDKDVSIAKLHADIHELELKCEAASTQAEASQPYEQRYREVKQMGSSALSDMPVLPHGYHTKDA